MRNKYHVILAVLAMLSVTMLNAQLYGPDVQTFNHATLNEGPVSMDVAFNGWIYESFIIDSGFVVVMSKDNGDTWITVDSSVVNGNVYEVKIVVAGSDTNSLRVYQAVNQYTVSTSDNIFYVNTYNGNTGEFIGNNILDQYTFNSPTRDFAIVTDYKFPSVISAPYAIGLLYAKGSNFDSLFLITSVDSGAQYGNRQLIEATPGYFRNVSMAYGKSVGYGDGRFFMAWDRFNSGLDTLGNVEFTYTPDYINDSVFTVINIDSIYPSTVYQLRNPKISASVSGTVANDSSNVTALIVVERIGTGLTNSNILGFSNLSPIGGSNYWYGFDIENTTQNTLQPDVSFDPSFNNFLLTYYNATTKQLPYIVNGFNLTTPSAWIDISNNYVNDTTKLLNPWPTVRINPIYTRAAFGWTNTYNGVPQAMFDGEFRLPVPVITSLSPDSVIAGNTSFQLTVNGSQLSGTSNIYWAMDSLASTFVNSGQLTATVAATLVLTPDSVGIAVYTPSTTGGGGWSNTLQFYIVIATAINNLGGRNTVMVYPNPASNRLNIAYSFTEAGNMDVDLYDMDGRLVKQLSNLNYINGNGNMAADVADLAPGMYQLVINTAQGATTRKISIVR